VERRGPTVSDTDYAALVARLRAYADGAYIVDEDAPLIREAANVIERLDPDAEHNSWKHSEIRKLQVRVRELEAVERAARELLTHIQPGPYGVGFIDVNDLRAALRDPLDLEAELTRLRAVEKAAREYIEMDMSLAEQGDFAQIDTLRAALREEGGHICGSSCPKYDEVREE